MDSSITAIKMEKRTLLENHLNESMARYETLFNGNHDAIFALDLDGYFIQVNPSCESMVGFSADELTEMTFQMLVPVEDLHQVFHNFHQTFEGKIQNYDYKITNKSGQLVYLNVTNLPISVNDEIVGVYGIAKDITPFKLKQEGARKTQEIHRLLIENSLDMITRTDLEGNYLYISPACEEILGYTPEEIVNKNVSLFIHYHDRKRANSNQNTLLVHGGNGSDTYRMRKKDGSYIWVESLYKPLIDHETNKVIEMISVTRDITERKKAEDEVRKREETYRNLIEHSLDATILAMGDEILFINETGAKLLGALNKDRILEKSILDIVHPDYREMAAKQIKKVEMGVTTDFLEYKLIRIDGSEVEVEVKGIPTIYKNKSVRHIIIRDITERKKTQDLLLNSEKLSVAGQLAAGIAHEVRNPLTAIKGFLQLLQSELESPPKYFDIIHSEMDRIELILSELLVLAKPQDLKFEMKELMVLVEHVKTLIDTHAIMKNIVIETHYEPDPTIIRCDENQLKQVFINFMKNSIEAMPDGGTITIEISKHGTNKIKLLFKDTGSGIPKHLLKRIGQPFFTTKENGTGLGFMISKQIIENHDGTIHIWSDPKGTIIEVILPIQ